MNSPKLVAVAALAISGGLWRVQRGTDQRRHPDGNIGRRGDNPGRRGDNPGRRGDNPGRRDDGTGLRGIDSGPGDLGGGLGSGRRRGRHL